MNVRRAIAKGCVVLLVVLSAAGLASAASDLADAAMRKNSAAVRSLLGKADVNAAQIDGTTALHWAAHWDDLEMADLLIKAGAKAAVANRVGATPLSLACINGDAVMIEKLLKAGADANAQLSSYGDTALMMAARTGKPDAVKVLLAHGANVNARETFSGTTALMWAAGEEHSAIVQMLIAAKADLNVRTKIVGEAKEAGGAGLGAVPEDPKPDGAFKSGWSGGMTALMMSSRQGDQASTKLLVAGGADMNIGMADGKTALELAIYNGQYDEASLLIDLGANVNHSDVDGFTPLFLAADRRNIDVSNTIPWTITSDPLPLIEKMIKAGANVNAKVKSTLPYRGSIAGQTRLRYNGGTALTRAAFAGDLALSKLLLANGADPMVMTNDRTSILNAAAGYGFIDDYSVERTKEERLELVKLLVGLGLDVNEPNNLGITPVMVASHKADLAVIQYLVDQGADLSAHDTGKGNGASTEPLMALDYAIGVTTFQPNAIVNRPQAETLVRKLMTDRGIKHTTSECTLRGFTCLDIDPKTASPVQIQTLRKRQIGNQVQGITGGQGLTPTPKQ